MAENNNNNNNNDTVSKKEAGVECVGTLLIPQDDVKGLSKQQPPVPPQECVGTLLVPCRDLQELSHQTNTTTSTTSPGHDNLVHLINEELHKPVTQDSLEEIDEALLTWSS